MGKEIYVLNLAFTDFSVQGVTQLNMYNSLLGDTTAIENFINRNEKISYLKDYTFFSSSLVFNYFPSMPNSRNVKEVMEKIIHEFNDEIKLSDKKKYFVIFLHGHGICGYPTSEYPDGSYRIKTNENEDGSWEFLTINEILSMLNGILNCCNVYLILNTCHADTGYIFMNRFGDFNNRCVSVKYTDIENTSLFNNTQKLFDLHVLGMSSKSTISNYYREETLGINALLNIYHLGLDLNISAAFDILNRICEKSENGVLIPNMIVITNSDDKHLPTQKLVTSKGAVLIEEKINIKNIKDLYR